MKKRFYIVFLFVFAGLLFPNILLCDDDVTGLWKTLDDVTGKRQAVVAVYRYCGKVYGRVIASFDDKGVNIVDDMYRRITVASALVGEPAYNALTIIWDLKDKGGWWGGGKILDPGSPDGGSPAVYECDMWRDGENLIVRGKSFIFWRNQIWQPIDESEFPEGFVIPDWRSFKPEIPEIKY